MKRIMGLKKVTATGEAEREDPVQLFSTKNLAWKLQIRSEIIRESTYSYLWEIF
jgi:hypothetical protein